jgi:hypothetical protein
MYITLSLPNALINTFANFVLPLPEPPAIPAKQNDQFKRILILLNLIITYNDWFINVL